MKNIIKYIILIIPVLIFLDVKIGVSSAINIGIKDVLMILLLILLLLYSVTNFKFANSVLNQKVNWLLVFFICISLLNNYLNGSLNNSLVNHLRIGEGLFLLVGIQFYSRHFKMRPLYISIIISCIILCFQILLFQSDDLKDPVSTIGALGSMWLVIGLYVLRYKADILNLNKVIVFLLYVLLFTATWITERRTWLFIFLGIIAYDYFKKFSAKKLFVVIILSVVVLLLWNEISAKLVLNRRLMSGLDIFTDFNFSTLDSRFYRWGTAWLQIKNNWFFGVGYQNINLNLPSWVDTDNPDNQYLAMWLQNGLIPLISYVAILILQIRRKKIEPKKDKAFFKMLFISFLLGGMTWAIIDGYGILLFCIMLGLSIRDNTRGQITISNT